MKIVSTLKAVGTTVLVALLVIGCASAPTQEMADARQALQAAESAGAATHAPANLKGAKELLSKAEKAIGDGDYNAAKADAIATKKAAVSARNIALAIGTAEKALNDAEAVGAPAPDARALLARARTAAERGDEVTAVKLANEAKAQGESVKDRYYLKQAKAMLEEAGVYRSRMSATEQARYRDALAAVGQGDGWRAYDIAKTLMSTLDTSTPLAVESYQVVRGDSLWGISGQEVIYDNPYYWPLIFKANADRIRDADLIYPGQGLDIPRGYGRGEADAAVDHARNRGAWSLGTVEASDRTYLGR
ncbi:MAG: DUF4398 domain-containing protein [Gammaproteobacteria bacterium]|nr:DUF4398 domain-containing protein [Gammaproteobacteria bacterium]